MLLADQIMAFGIPDAGVATTEKAITKRMPELLADASIFEISNVAEYLFAVTDQENWDLAKDFDCVAPPFPYFWLEYRKPTRLNSEEFGVMSTAGWPARTGVLGIAADASTVHEQLLDPIGFTDYIDELKARMEAAASAGILQRILEKRKANPDPIAFRASLTKPELWTQDVIDELQMIQTRGLEAQSIIYEKHAALGARWYVKLHLFTMVGPMQGFRRDTAQGPLARWDLAVDEQGRIVDNRYNTTPVLADIQERMCREGAAGGGLGALFYPVLLALDFLHLKNVAVHRVEADPKLQKIHVKRYKEPLVKYHVLELEPLKRVLEAHQAHRKGGFKQALHKVRLHYRTYGEDGRGLLFGKLAGRFMIPAHLRGDPAEGVTMKDYRVETPKKGTDR